MATYYKPQSPIQSGEDFIYPITTADQIILSDGSRLEKNGQISTGGGTVKTVSGVAPDSAGNVALTADKIGYGGNSNVSEALSSLKDDLVDLQTKTRINYLRPTLQTATQNGVTCTDNGDGTYTLNGTATQNTFFAVGEIDTKNMWYKMVGCPSGGNYDGLYSIYFDKDGDSSKKIIDNGDGVTFKVNGPQKIYIKIVGKYSANNLVFKPMITDDLSATYDDFVSYYDSPIKRRDIIDKSSIGDAWTSGKTYAVGDYCISGNQLYKCKTAHTAGITFNADYWYTVTLADEITESTKFIKTKRTVKFQYSSGQIGSRANQTAITDIDVSKIISINLDDIATSIDYFPVPFISGNALYVNIYRASSNAVSKGAVNLIILSKNN